MEQHIWWVWMGLAALFLIAEIFTAGFFLLWFSFGAAAAGILALLDVGVAGQLAVFIIGSGILFVFGRRFAERVTVKQPPGIGADRFVDVEGIVLVKIDNAANTGSVRVGQDEWRAKSQTGEVIPEGAHVKVVKVDGTRAIVKTIKEEN
ncbi:NfeD family protein [candidate division KSB1 bacterium]